MSGQHQALARADAVNVAYAVERCRVLGPGERFVLWAQGCPRRCPGCHTPQFQPFVNALWTPVSVLGDWITSVPGIEGLTLVGGEPMLQAAALAAVATKVREAGLSTMVYSGFEAEQLRSGVVPDAGLLLEACDLLMDGLFAWDLPTTKPWRGSDNQRLIALSPRYADRVDEWNQPVGQGFEVRLRPGGEVEVLGIPPAGLVDAEHNDSEERRIDHV